MNERALSKEHAHYGFETIVKITAWVNQMPEEIGGRDQDALADTIFEYCHEGIEMVQEAMEELGFSEEDRADLEEAATEYYEPYDNEAQRAERRNRLDAWREKIARK